MKKFIFTLVSLFTLISSADAMSYEQARDEALFLTDKMAYELNLNEDQYEAAYEINLDYLMDIRTADDLYGDIWYHRNTDLRYVLLDWQYNAFCAASYFFRPVYWNAGYWQFSIYAHYPHRTHFYFSRPVCYVSYRGAHSWRHNGGSWYVNRVTYYRGHTTHTGMRDVYHRSSGTVTSRRGNTVYNRSNGSYNRGSGTYNRGNSSYNRGNSMTNRNGSTSYRSNVTSHRGNFTSDRSISSNRNNITSRDDVYGMGNRSSRTDVTSSRYNHSGNMEGHPNRPQSMGARPSRSEGMSGMTASERPNRSEGIGGMSTSGRPSSTRVTVDRNNREGGMTRPSTSGVTRPSSVNSGVSRPSNSGVSSSPSSMGTSRVGSMSTPRSGGMSPSRGGGMSSSRSGGMGSSRGSMGSSRGGGMGSMRSGGSPRSIR